MELYAAMVDGVDQNIGRLLQRLEQQGKLDNTLILFLSDNGACAKTPKVAFVDPKAPMGSVVSYDSYGQTWASVCNTPVRRWKTKSFEDGINTPLAVHWPAGITPQTGWNREPAHVIDIMPTLFAVTGATYPGTSKEARIPPPDARSDQPLYQSVRLCRAAEGGRATAQTFRTCNAAAYPLDAAPAIWIGSDLKKASSGGFRAKPAGHPHRRRR